MPRFYDNFSKELYNEIPSSNSVLSKVMLNIDQFNIGQSFVTAKLRNRYRDTVIINIEGGFSGIELQKSLFQIEEKEPKIAYIIIRIRGSIFIRKLPILGIKDWLLIYDDTLFLLAVNDTYDEIEILLV